MSKPTPPHNSVPPPPPPPPAPQPQKKKFGCLGICLILGAVVIALYALSTDASRRSYEDTMGQLVDSTEENTKEYESLVGSDAYVTKMDKRVDGWQDEIRDHADRRESDRTTLLVIAGILFVVGALFIR